MRESGRAGSIYLPSNDPLGEVMELIGTETAYSRTQDSLLPLCPGIGSAGGGGGSLLDTVIFNPVPTEPAIPTWEMSHNTELPRLMITEQPKQRGMRFRYQCEGRSAGSILGESSTEHTKTLPTIMLLNCQGIHEVHISVCLVWKDSPHRIHPHCLVGKDCHNGICEITLHPDDGEIEHSFSNLGIQCVRKKEIETSVKTRLNFGIDPYNAGMWRHHEEVDLNVVRLCFQAWYFSPTEERMNIEPVLSEPVYDKKSTNTSELKIYRMNKERGRCEGGEEVYILCDKVQKEDIQVMFIDRAWEARADFSQADVHRQIAIVLKTPPYRDLHIKDPAPVQVYLQRITDGIRSEPVIFTYMPPDNDSYKVCRKRPRMSSPLDDAVGPDPHGIEERRRQPRPNYTDYCSHQSDFGLAAFPNFTFNGVNLDDPAVVEDTPLNIGIFASYLDLDLDETGAFFESLPSYTEDDATANLVGYSLNLTGEQDRQYSDCSYQDDTRMGGC